MPAVGSHVPQARNGGTWKNWSKFFARDGGTWKRPLSVHVRSGGSWVKVYDERPVITNVTTSYFTDTSDPFVPVTTYYKNFTVAANGFQTTLTGTGLSLSFSQTTVNVDEVANVTSQSVLIGDYNPANMHSVTATNASGSQTV